MAAAALGEPAFVLPGKALGGTPTAVSRSTSAGSGSGSASVGSADGCRSSSDRSSQLTTPLVPATGAPSCWLPEYDYPVPVVVRNTFIDTQVTAPASWAFLQERRIQSWPGVDPPPGLFDAVGRDTRALEEQSRSVLLADMAAGAAAGAAAVAARAMQVAASRWRWPPAATEGTEEAASCGCGRCGATGPAAEPRQRVLRLADHLAAAAGDIAMPPSPASPLRDGAEAEEELPSMGSAGHRFGTCKPCAFLHTKGCANGKQCTFCHLCEPGEKKRRQKEKAAAQRQLRNA